jgi:microcystin-dependent protein
MSKKTLLSHVATVPIGSIMPYAGSTAPAGYFLCDGSEVQISAYSDLFNVIGYNYKATSALRGLNTFGLPDLRGRFPLGKDNMTNNITVPSKDGSGTQISTGGGAAKRVSDVTASTLGGGNGAELVAASTTTVVPSTASGKVPMAPSTFGIMDPYQTVNYIIFHGVL